MDAQRWQRVTDIFLAALEREPANQVPFVHAAAGGDHNLCRDIEAMLESHQAAGGFLELAAVQAADTRVPMPRAGAAQTLHEPRRFGDYELLEEIAHGGMGVVFKARQVSLNRIVAVKTIVGGALASPHMVQRFHTEAEAAASLAHPNIVPIYEIGEHDGQHYFSMRLVEGGSLEQRFADFALPPGGNAAGRSAAASKQSVIAQLVATIARAVHHAHQRGVLHRDLKPANILLDPAGEPQVTDFGIAKLLLREASLTESLAVVGTPRYMAPEQASGTATLTTAADVFSLGAILYHLLTGRVPFDAPTPMATLQQLIEREPPVPRAHNAAIDRDLETICLKCLNKDPQRRYGSAEALADDLDRWRDGEAIVARPVSRAERAWRWCRRKPLLATLWLGLAAAVCTGVVVSSVEWRRAERTAVTLRENLYAADLGVAFQAWDAGYIARARELLEAYRPRPGDPDLRTFEWRYLFGLTRERELLTIDTGSANVWGSAIAPDGRMLATGAGDGDGRIRLWQLPGGSLLATLQADRGIIYGLAFSPDGRLLASAGTTNEVLVWDVATRTLAGRLGPHRGAVLSVAFSHDGRTLASMAGYPYATAVTAELTLWDVASLEKIAPLEGHHSSSGWMDFSPDDRVLATPLGNGTIVLWDVASRRMVATLSGHHGLVVIARFSPDGRWLASAGVDGTVRLWDVQARREAGTLGTHQGSVYSIAFSPDGTRLVSGSIDHTAKLWDVANRREVTTFRGHVSRIFSVNYARDGRTLATASLDGTARIWDARVPPDVAVFDRHEGHFAYLGYSADGRWLLRSVPSAPQVTIWGTSSQTKMASVPEEAAGLSPDGRVIATASAPDVLVIRDLSFPLPRPRLAMRLPGPPLVMPTFSPDSRSVAVGHGVPSETVSVWDVATGHRTALLAPTKNAAAPTACAFSPGGGLLAVGYADGRVRLWETRTWSVARLLEGQARTVRAVAFSPDGRFLATGGDDTTVELRRVTFDADPVVLRGDVGAVYALGFSTDSQSLAVGSVDGVVKLWNVRAGREVTTLKAHGSVVSSLAFSPDGSTLATISVDQTMRLWKAPSLTGTGR